MVVAIVSYTNIHNRNLNTCKYIWSLYSVNKTDKLAAKSIKKTLQFFLKMMMNLVFLTLMLSQPTLGIKIYLIIWYMANYAE